MMVHITPTMLWATYCIGWAITSFLIALLYDGRCTFKHDIIAIVIAMFWPLILALGTIVWCAVLIYCICEAAYNILSEMW